MPPDAPERNRLFLEMTRQMEVDGAWSLHVSRERNQMIRPWVHGLQEAPDPARPSGVYLDVAPRSDTSANARETRAIASRSRFPRARRRRASPPSSCWPPSGAAGVRRDMNKVIRDVFPVGGDRLRSRRGARPVLGDASCRRSSRRSTPTTTSRGPRRSCRWWPRRCRRSPRTARATPSSIRQGHPLPPTIRRSAARSASSSPTTSSTRSSA